MPKALLILCTLIVCGFTAQTTYGQNYVTAQATNKGFVCIPTTNGGNKCMTINQLVSKQPLEISARTIIADSLPPAMASISWGATLSTESLISVANFGLDFSANSSNNKHFQFDRKILKQAADADPYLALALFNLEKLQTGESHQAGQIMFIPGELSTEWMRALIDSQQTFEEFYAQQSFSVNFDRYQTPVVYHYQITEFEDQSGVMLTISKAKTN